MSERVAKRLRRENPGKKEPEVHMSFGPSRKRRRSYMRLKDRSYTAKGPQVRMVDMNEEVHHKQAQHIVQDFSHQEDKTYALWPNNMRMQARKAQREAAKKNAARQPVRP